MKRIVILGGGTAGTIAANRLRRVLEPVRYSISVVDPDPLHYYQPGLLFLPFGLCDAASLTRPRSSTLAAGVEWAAQRAERIDAEAGSILLADGQRLPYDYLIIATGTQVHPEETAGLPGPGWQREVFEFYTPAGALALGEFFKGWNGGRLVVSVAEMPIKCPVAPIEFLFLADWWFATRGLRDRVELELATPLDGAFTRPMCSRVLGHMFDDKRITLTTEFPLAGVDQQRRVIRDWAGRELGYDLLVVVPVHMGAQVIRDSGLGDDLGFVATHPHTLQSKLADNIFVIGDATDLPSSKAGSVAHFQSEILVANLLAALRGEALPASFDGHANCFIETGYHKAVMVDFNYDIEPLPGKYPLPGVGPFTLLAESRVNHWGKLAFAWLYWNVLLPGRPLPLPAHMSMAGKHAPRDAVAEGDN